MSDFPIFVLAVIAAALLSAFVGYSEGHKDGWRESRCVYVWGSDSVRTASDSLRIYKSGCTP